MHCFLLAPEYHSLVWFSLYVFEYCEHHCHLLRKHHYTHQSATLPYISPDVKPDRSMLLIILCWSSILLSWSCFPELAELTWLALLCFWRFLRMGLLWSFTVDVAVMTDAFCCYFSCTLKNANGIYVFQYSYFCILWQGYLANGVIDDGNFKIVMYSCL